MQDLLSQKKRNRIDRGRNSMGASTFDACWCLLKFIHFTFRNTNQFEFLNFRVHMIFVLSPYASNLLPFQSIHFFFVNHKFHNSIKRANWKAHATRPICTKKIFLFLWSNAGILWKYYGQSAGFQRYKLERNKKRIPKGKILQTNAEDAMSIAIASFVCRLIKDTMAMLGEVYVSHMLAYTLSPKFATYPIHLFLQSLIVRSMEKRTEIEPKTNAIATDLA